MRTPHAERSAPSRRLVRTGLAAALLAAVALVSIAAARPEVRAADAGPTLQSYHSRYYLVHTNLTREEAREFGRHMDAIFSEYSQRFSSFRGADRGPMPLFLLRTQQDYIDFMATSGINAQNSGGMYFVVRGNQGLATWANGRSRNASFHVLQHEGFHQFAWEFIGHELPVWVNEGLAQYFEDGIIVGRGMKVGLSNGRRIASVKQALEDGEVVDFEQLLGMDNATWRENVIGGGRRAILQYDQSWSIVYFLIHGDRGRYRGAFEKYLHLVSRGTDSWQAFSQSFGNNDLRPFRRRWEQFARQHTADEITDATAKMEFLGQGLLMMRSRGEEMPASAEALKRRLNELDFRVVWSSHGITREYHASDDAMFRFVLPQGGDASFRLLEPAADKLPPRITAPGLKPEPTLTWSTGDDDALVQEIVYR